MSGHCNVTSNTGEYKVWPSYAQQKHIIQHT